MSGALVNVPYQPRSMAKTPRQLGPTMRIPLSRAIRAISACARAPSSPCSAKPEVKTTADFTPRSAQSRMASTAIAAGTAIRAQSTGSGTSRIVGYAVSPCTVSRRGLTG